MRKTLLTTLLLALCLAAGLAQAAGLDQAAPAIVFEETRPNETPARVFDARITLALRDEDYRGRDLYLAYHVDTEADLRLAGDMLRFEAPLRVPIVWDADGRFTVDLPVDLSGLSEKVLYVHYDILDLDAEAWLRYLPDTLDGTLDTTLRYSKTGEAFANMRAGFLKNPVLSVFNVAFFLLALGLLFRLRGTLKALNV